jgi:type II secretory pathway pseudopilin PulG
MNRKRILWTVGITLGVLAALAVIALVFGFVVYAPNQRTQQQAIISVFRQCAKAVESAMHVKELGRGERQHSVTNFSTREYIAGIRKIPTANCPAKFRLAWLNYVQTYQRAFEDGTLDFAARDLAFKTEFLLAVKSTSGAVAKDALGRMDKNNVAEAERRVEMVALEYGVGH